MSDRTAARLALSFYAIAGPCLIVSVVDAVRQAGRWEKSRRAVALAAAVEDVRRV